MSNNSLHAEPIPDSVSAFYHGERTRCPSVRHGQQCLRAPGHTGEHMATIGAFMRWDRQVTIEEIAERNCSALLWVEWARALGLDAPEMQCRLLEVCERVGSHPSDLLFNLFERR